MTEDSNANPAGNGNFPQGDAAPSREDESSAAQAASAAPQALDWNGLTLFLVTIVAIALSAIVAWPFLPGITAAAVLAIVTARPFRWLNRHIRNRTLAATCALLIVVLSVVVPSVLVIGSVGGNVIQAIRGLQSGAAQSALNDLLVNHPQADAIYQRLTENLDAGQVIEKAAGIAATRLALLLGQSVTAVVQIIAMLFILFFLYRDGEEATQFAHSLLPLGPKENHFLLERVRLAISALVLGRFAVAGLQGILAGVTYALLGLHNALVLGVATTLLALVPAVGAVAVWLPVVVYLSMTGHWLEASILFAIGGLVISTLDNFLYPILVGEHLKLHTVPVFLSMLGGVWLFGVTGIVLGPVVFNATGSLILIWRHRAHGEPLPVDDPAAAAIAP